MKSNLLVKCCPYCGNKLIKKMLEGRKRLLAFIEGGENNNERSELLQNKGLKT